MARRRDVAWTEEVLCHAVDLESRVGSTSLLLWMMSCRATKRCRGLELRAVFRMLTKAKTIPT